MLGLRLMPVPCLLATAHGCVTGSARPERSLPFARPCLPAVLALCSPRPGAVSPAQDADSLQPCFPLPGHATTLLLGPHQGLPFAPASPTVPCAAPWVLSCGAVTATAGCPLAHPLLGSASSFATLVLPTAVAVGPLPWPDGASALPIWAPLCSLALGERS